MYPLSRASEYNCPVGRHPLCARRQLTALQLHKSKHTGHIHPARMLPSGLTTCSVMVGNGVGV